MVRKYAFFCFIGIDGSGKTTQALSLNDYFKEKGLNSKYVWSRREPCILKIPGKLIKRYILKEREATEGHAYLSIKKKRKGLFGNKIVSFLLINFSLLEYLFLLYLKIFIPNRNNDVLICDRYLYDAIVDFALNCPFSHSMVDTLLKNLISNRFPKPDRLYFIDINADVGVSRKKDGTSKAYLEDRIPLYQYIAQIAGATIVDGTLSLNDIKKTIHEDAAKVFKRSHPNFNS